MGTEVLRPPDCLARVRAHPAKWSQRSAARPAARHSTAQRGQAAPVRREVRVKVAAADAYAGPAFAAMSPSPRALPLPRFSSRVATAAAAGVDDSATRELRLLLGLQLDENLPREQSNKQASHGFSNKGIKMCGCLFD